MTMKTSDAPRRLYTRAGIVYLCFQGRYYGADMSVSQINPEREVKAVAVEGEGGKQNPEIVVTQRRPGRKSIVETWSTFTFERATRGASEPPQAAHG